MASSIAKLSQQAALVPYIYAARGARVSQQAALVPYAVASRGARIAQQAALVVYSAVPTNTPRISQQAALVVWGTTPPSAENRTRAWTFILDGHRFYVLDLGQEGTFLYDIDTGQWAQWETSGFIGWNMRAGTNWQIANRIVAVDTLYGEVWEMSPGDVLDEDFRTITHLTTGGVMTRSRIYISASALRVSGSVGFVQDPLPGVTMNVRFSDDGGNTWTELDPVLLTEGAFGGPDNEVAWRSLGSFMAPGRILEFSDEGGMLRIDGADLFLTGFDDDSEAGAQ